MSQYPEFVIKSRVKRVVQVNWRNWSDVCSLTDGLISRDNAARNVDHFNHNCGEVAGPYIEFDIPPHLIVEGDTTDTAYHGDYVITFEDGKVMVAPYMHAATLLALVINQSENLPVAGRDAPEGYVFDAKDHPMFSRWRHRNGNEYIITGYRNMTQPSRPGYPVMIDYNNVHTGEAYGGAAWDWHRRLTRI